MVNIDFKNLNLLQKEAREGALLGFTGKDRKLYIHVPVININ